MTPDRAWTAEVRGWFTDNLVYKALAILFAVALWAWVQSELVVEERARVRVDWRLPEGLVLAEAPLEQATVTLQGAQAFVRAARQKELQIRVDLTKAKAGEVNLDLASLPIAGLPDRVRVVGTAPATLQVRLEQMLRRRVSVAPATEGEVRSGYRVRSVRVDPDTAELSGAASVLRGLAEVSTDEVDISGLRETTAFEVGLDLQSRRLSMARAQAFTVTVEVEATEVERTFAAVPVLVRSEAWTSPVRTVAVTLTGPPERVQGLGEDELSVVVVVPDDFAGPTGEARRGGRTGLRFEVIHTGGNGVEVTGTEPATIPVEAR